MTLRSAVLIFSSGALVGGLVGQWRACSRAPVAPAAVSLPRVFPGREYPAAPPGWIHPTDPPIWPADRGIFVPSHAYQWQFPPDIVLPSAPRR